MSDMISHVFLENTKFLINKSKNVVSFFLTDDLIEKHPEISDYADFLPVKNISSVLLGESFTILPFEAFNLNHDSKKAICIRSSLNDDEIDEELIIPNFAKVLAELDNTFQKLLSES
jgi:hypothetical protein